MDATGDALAGLLGPGEAGSNTVADHVEVLDRALAQAEVAEITHLLDTSIFPDGTRLIVRRERPHPGAALTKAALPTPTRPARIVRTARRTILRISHTWPWARELVAAYTRLAAPPRLAT